MLKFSVENLYRGLAVSHSVMLLQTTFLRFIHALQEFCGSIRKEFFFIIFSDFSWVKFTINDLVSDGDFGAISFKIAFNFGFKFYVFGRENTHKCAVQFAKMYKNHTKIRTVFKSIIMSYKSHHQCFNT